MYNVVHFFLILLQIILVVNLIHAENKSLDSITPTLCILFE